MNRRILKLAIPNIISNLTVPLLGAVDTALVGHLDDVAYLGAIALGGTIFNFIFWGFGFLRMGTTGLTAQAFGGDNRTEEAAILGRALLVAGLFSLLIVLLQYPIGRLSMLLIDSSPQVRELTLSYYTIRIYSAPAVLGLYVFNGWFLGVQNARYPMIATIALNLLNVVLDVYFVYGAGMDVDGVALGSLIAQWFGFLLAAGLFLYRYRDRLTYFSKRIVSDLTAFALFFRVNRDIFIRTLCLIFTFTFFTFESAKFGEGILAANTILLQLWMMMSYGIDGFAYAAEALVGRFKGAADPLKMKQAVRGVLLWGAGIGLGLSVVYGLADRLILNLFTSHEAVIATALSMMAWTIAAPFVGSFSYIWDGIFIGATETSAMRNTMLFSTAAVFLPCYLLLEPFLGVDALWLAMLSFLASRGLLLTLYAPSRILNRT